MSLFAACLKLTDSHGDVRLVRFEEENIKANVEYQNTLLISNILYDGDGPQSILTSWLFQIKFSRTEQQNDLEITKINVSMKTRSSKSIKNHSLIDF